MVRRLAVVGTGLIGASVGLAARRVGVEEVRGWDLDGEALAVAGERGAVQPASSLEDAVDGAELAVVAAPVASLPAEVANVLEASQQVTTVTDVGSTKGPVARAVGDPRFIGGHPVCGSEARGPAHASGELFEGATWFLTPVAATEPERYRTLHGFVASLGAVPVAVDPEAAGNRRRMLTEAYDEPGQLQRLRVHVPDRPGVLAGITQGLGAERINIEDFELHHMSRERGGTLTLFVGGEDDADRAAALLEAQGYQVVISPVLPE